MSTESVGSQALPTLCKPKVPVTPCPQLPGTVLRIFIPAGAVINLLNLIEVTSPSGICLIIRLPFLAGDKKCGLSLGDIKSAIQGVGGSVEVL